MARFKGSDVITFFYQGKANRYSKKDAKAR